MIRFATIRLSKIIYYAIIILMVVSIMFFFLRISRNKDKVVSVFQAEGFQQETGKQSNIVILGDKEFKGIVRMSLPLLVGIDRDDFKEDKGFSLTTTIKSILDIRFNDPKTFLVLQMPMMNGYQATAPVMVQDGNKDEKVMEGEGEEHDIYRVDQDGKIVFRSKSIKKDDLQFVDFDLTDIHIEGEGPQIMIYHSHTTEAYKQTKESTYKQTDSFRTDDLKYTVARVGKQLAYHLKKDHHIDIYHDYTYHDYPVWDYSYNRSLDTINKIYKENPSIKVFFDVHRNAYGRKIEEKDFDIVDINGQRVAQILIVVGSDQKMEHPSWKENYGFAVKLKDTINAKYPGLCKSILVKAYRYNQHISNRSLIIEIGSTETTLDEALLSTRYLAESIAEIVK